MTTEQRDAANSRVLSTDELGVGGEFDGPILPPGLQKDGLWLMVIRAEIDYALTSGAYLQVRKQPPWFLRWLLKPWLHFQSPLEPEERK